MFRIVPPKEPFLPNRENLAWAAGFYDGEGCIYIHQTRNGTYVGIVVGQTDREPLDRFNEATGMLVKQVNGPMKSIKNGKEYKDRFEYRFNSFERTQAVVAMLWPWLSRFRKERARELLIISSPKRRVVECPQGHAYDESNTYVDSKGARRCRICHRTESKRRYTRQKGVTSEAYV